MILFMDSFDHYLNADILKKWTTNTPTPGIQVGVGRRGTAGYAGQIAPFPHLYKALTPGDNKFLAAGAFKFMTIASNPNCFSAQDGGSDRFTTQVVTYLTNAGEIAVYHGANTMTHLGTTAGAGITAGVYFHLSVEILIHPSAGTVKLAVNGVTLLDLTGKDTQYTANMQWNGVRVGGESATGGSLSTYCYVDDIVIGDGTGGSNDTLYPDLNVDIHRPTADGNSIMSTPSGSPPGNRYDNVNDVSPATAPDDYNTLVAASDKDTFVVQDLAIPGSAIRAVQTMVYAKKADSGLATMKPVIRHSSTDYDGTEVGLSTALNYYREVYNKNPGAGPGDWTEAHFNAAEFGYKRIT